MISDKTYQIYEVIDIPFYATIKGNPFLDVVFFADISGEGYNEKIEGFFNGEGEFILRCSFNKAGSYNFKTTSNETELDGQSGTITVIEDKNSSRRGPIVLDDTSPNRLFYEDGSHYNLCAFECDWLFALDYKDQVELTNTKKLIDHIDDNAFNHVVMNVYAYDLQWERDEWERDPRIKPEHDFSAREDIYPYGGSNSNPDFEQLNVTLFKHLDNIIQLLDEKNIISHLMIYVWNKKVNWPDAGSKWDNMYFDYVVKRYQAYSNIMWDISKEALGYGRCDMSYIVDRIERLRSMDPYNRLVTVHDYTFCDNYPDLVDVISTQTWVLDIHNRMLDTAKKHKDKVIFNIEHGGYEESPYQIFTGNYTDPKMCLRRNYEIALAGVYTCFYWQALSWSIMVMPWESEVGPYSEYYKHMKLFFDEHQYEEMVPYNAIGHGGYSMVNPDKTKVLMYSPKENSAVTIAGRQEFKGNEGSYRFFNTITGEYSETKQVTFKQHNIFRSPFKDDSVLVVER